MTQNHKILLIINPNAGSGKNKKTIKSIIKFYDDREIECDIFYTSPDTSATKLVGKNFNNEYERLVLAGGDGTINEAINGLPDFDRPVGIIPLGKGNDYIKNLNLGRNLNEKLITTIGNHFTSVDIGVANNRLFINGIGAGFDGQIIKNLLSSKTLLTGHLAYLYHVIKILGSFEEQTAEITIDGKSLKEDILLVLVGKGTTFGGGFKLLPNAKVDDGFLEVCIIGRVKPIKRFFYLNKLKNGTHGEIKNVSFYKARNVEILLGNIESQIDGELFERPPLSIKLKPNKVKLLTKEGTI